MTRTVIENDNALEVKDRRVSRVVYSEQYQILQRGQVGSHQRPLSLEIKVPVDL